MEPIVHNSKVYYQGTNITKNVTDDAYNNPTVFINDNDVLYVGNTQNFTTIGISLATPSNINNLFTYSYCNSSGRYQPLLGVTDTTAGFTLSGTIQFPNPINRGKCHNQTNGIPFSDLNNYSYVAITRTRNFVLTPPVINTLSISGATINMFLKDDMLRLNPVNIAPETCTAINLGAIYFDISEDDMCVCKSGGWKVMTDGSDCT